ncbi:MAG: CHASE2 domain-containing protein [Spirochaetes bacterium]|nr:CHASE2 domain-containing protein [Spirochaetota bacterium]
MKFEKKHFIYLLVGLVASLLVYTLYNYTKIIDNLELMSLDGMFDMRGGQKKSVEGVIQKNPRLNDKIIIIGIDDASINKFGRFPWNRRKYADFLARIRSAKPAAIFFDIFFTEYSNPVDDGLFFNALRANRDRKVFFDYPPKTTAEEEESVKIMDARLKYLEKSALDPVKGSKFLRTYRYFSIPLPEILQSSTGAGHAAIEQDVDSVYRKLPLVIRYKDKLYPQIVFSIAMSYFKVPKENVEIKLGKYVKLKDAKVPVKDEFGDIVDYKTKDIKIPVDQYGKMLINFAGPPYEFKSQSQYISFAEVFKIDPEYFNDKILFFGMFVQGSAHDMWPTPYDIMYGIEINANALNTILQQDFLTFVPKWINFFIVIFIGLLIGFIVPRVKIWQSALVIFGLIIILSVLAFWIFFDSFNKIILYWVPLLSIILSYIGTLLYRILTEEKEKRFIKGRFSKYVSSSVVEELLKNPKALQLGGEDRFITVFFSDVRGFTTISEKLGEPQKLVALLNEYLSAMTEIIFLYFGTLDKYVGDEIMAFWGAPVPQPDHALLACKAALAQMKYLENVLYPKLEKEKKPLLYIGIGVNTGNMTVGNMGSKSRMDYTLMGDEVNLGSRLEGANKVYSTGIIISESTYEQVKKEVVARELDIIRVKGKSKPVKIFELMDLKNEEVMVPTIDLTS